MAKRKVSNLLALAILSLLTERPMHPYEVSAEMKRRGLADTIKLNYGSLYSVFEVLTREHLIVPQETQREGRHPERVIYAVTDAGRAELYDWLRALLCTPVKEYFQFAAGLAFLAHLTPDEVILLLEERVRLLTEQRVERQGVLDTLTQQGIDRLFSIEDEYTLALLDAEIAYIHRLIREMKEGVLTEKIDGLLCWKVRRLDLAYAPEGEEAASTNEKM